MDGEMSFKSIHQILKEQFVKWLPVTALACFVAAVFLIAYGHFWNGIVFIGAGTSLSSAAAIYKKKNDASDKNQEMR